MISAALIRAGRSLIGAKQSELAAAAGVSLATLNNIERGIGDPRASTLEAIERALADAGVEVEEDAVAAAIRLAKLARPTAFDPYFASKRVLEALNPDSLFKPERILFFIRWSQAAAGSDDPHRLGLLIEGRARALLFDQVDFNFASSKAVAEVAGILLMARYLHRDALFRLDAVQEDTTLSELGEAVRRLREQEWQALSHPRALVDMAADWDKLAAGYGKRADHPMAALIKALAAPATAAADPDPAPSSPTESEPPSGFLRTDATP